MVKNTFIRLSWLIDCISLDIISMYQPIRNINSFASNKTKFEKTVFCEVIWIAKQELSYIEKYEATFPTILRELMCNNSTTQKTLAELLDVWAQTVRLYINSATQPTLNTLLNIAQSFMMCQSITCLQEWVPIIRKRIKSQD